MKKLYSIILLFITANAFGQYCMPYCSTYASTMPGIINFTLNAINRTSADCEAGCPINGNNFVTISTTFPTFTTNLVRGQTYPISMNHTVDAPICPDMNLRVWIDYNHNNLLTDAGETVLLIDHHLPGVYSTSITIPMTALLGTTRLRATAKMSDLGGHSLPTPCNIPPDNFGYHGEMEDYTVNIISSTGIEELPGELNFFNAFPSPATAGINVIYALNKPAEVSLAAFDIVGKRIDQPFYQQHQSAGQHEAVISNDFIKSGIYFVRLLVNGNSLTRKVVIID